MLQGRVRHQWGWTKGKSPNTAGGMGYENTAQGYRIQYDFCHGSQQAANSPAGRADTDFPSRGCPGLSAAKAGGEHKLGTSALRQG